MNHALADGNEVLTAHEGYATSQLVPTHTDIDVDSDKVSHYWQQLQG